MVELPSASPEVRLAHDGPVFISCFLAWPNARNLAAVGDAQRALAHEFPRLLSLTIIPDASRTAAGAASAPTTQSGTERDASLKASANIGKELERSTAAAAMVVQARGVGAVMIRTFVAGLSLLGSVGFELKVFKTVSEAEAWLRTIEGAPAVPDGLAERVNAWLGTRNPRV